MAKLIMMRGLPASGKSTEARKRMEKDGNLVRLNRDLLREMLHFGVWNGRKESLTVDGEKALASHFLKANQSVIIDDTNLGQSHLDMWKNVAKDANAKFEMVDLATPVSTCRFRDMERTKKVGGDVITNMALRYGLHPAPEKGYIICDIDGTLANIDHRLHFVKVPEGEKKNWKGFFEAMIHDAVRLDTMKMLIEYQQAGYDIVFMSGRPDTYKKQTLIWLIQQTEQALPKGFLTLIMRRGGDSRQDDIVKKELLDAHFPDRSQIHMVIDDRPSVIRMWRENGLPVTDVGKGVEF